jgi:hypothetical protein
MNPLTLKVKETMPKIHWVFVPFLNFVVRIFLCRIKTIGTRKAKNPIPAEGMAQCASLRCSRRPVIAATGKRRGGPLRARLLLV